MDMFFTWIAFCYGFFSVCMFIVNYYYLVVEELFNLVTLVFGPLIFILGFVGFVTATLEARI